MRTGHLKEAMPPHSLALVMIGTGLLWVGWIGFNAGSALEANGVAALALLNTMVAPAAGALAWMAAGGAGARASRRCSAVRRAQSQGWSR
jgi:Amt family ammonium transporter